MSNSKNKSTEFYSQLREAFSSCIGFIKTHIGDDAFFNLKNDLVAIRKKFYPTVFDSIMIATKIALDRGFKSDEVLEERRLDLLRDDAYRSSITQGTMKLENIRTRIDKALSYLFDMKLDNE